MLIIIQQYLRGYVKHGPIKKQNLPIVAFIAFSTGTLRLWK